MSRKNKTRFLFSMSSETKDLIGILGIQSTEISSETLMYGFICVNYASDVSKVDLFMPDMGHGSSPPVVSKLDEIPKGFKIPSTQASDYGCFNISKIEMFMPGIWQVRVFYKSHSEGIFTVDVKK